MHSELKKRADDKDIRWLQYGFADCLDVDPTFEEYKEDFNYCCENVPEMFEKHMELTPRRDNQHSWTDDYWNMLKVDLLENFSRERFEHMRSVAKVVYAEKIARLEQERRQELETEQRHRELEQKNKRFEEEEIRKNLNVHRRVNSYNISSDQSDRNTEVQLNIIKPSKQQEQELEHDRKKLEQENKRFEEEIQKNRNIQNQPCNNTRSVSGAGGAEIKKAMGAVLVIVALIVVILILIRVI